MIRNRILATLLCFLFFSSLPALAQRPQPMPEPETKFERFTLRKGSVTVREFYGLGHLTSQYGTADFSVGRAYSPGHRDALLALRIEIKEAGTLERSRTGALDAEEVASLATALPQMVTMLSRLKDQKTQHYTEVDFRAGSLRIGFYFQSLGSGRSESLFIQAGGEIGGASVFFDPEKFPALQDLISKAVVKLRELQGQR